MKRWNILGVEPHNLDELIKILLKNRGVRGKSQINEFFHPPDPTQINYRKVNLSEDELDCAAMRIKKALSDQESIVVYTDYDADGVSAGTIMWETLHRLGGKVMPYVPHRVEEGYGLSQKGLDTVKKEFNPALIITLDHGVTAYEQVKYARKLGIDIIIVDHHTLPKSLPQSVALVHTTSLCAAGVAWFFARYLTEKLINSQLSIHNYQLTSYLDLVALATVADLVPLTSVNRSLVKYGLVEINRTERVGLRALIRESALKFGEIGTYELGHLLAPRINASGRLTHALDSLRLLCTKDKDRAKELAEKLSLTNKERQLLLEETVLHAKDLYKGHPLLEQGVALSKKLIFLSHASYNQGVIGLVAGKLVDEYYRPSIVVSQGEVYSKASARSISGFNIIETLRKVTDLLVDVGGHPMAAGFTVETRKLALLEKRLMEIAERELSDDQLVRELRVDCEIDLSTVTLDLYRKLELFAPFGVGNPEPVFATRNVFVQNLKLVGNSGKHLKLQVGEHFLDCIGFAMGELSGKISPGTRVDLAYTIDLNRWNNNYRLQLKLKDVKI